MKIDSSDNEAFSKLEQSIKGALCLQLLAALLFIIGVAVVGFLTAQAVFEQIQASLFGAALAIVSTLLSARSMRRADQAESRLGESAKYSLAPIFSGLLNKLVIVGGGIGFGLVIGLNPTILIAAYLFVQISTAIRLVVSYS